MVEFVIREHGSTSHDFEHLLSHDAKQTVDDMDISYEECHWQVTNTGKIDFLELFAGTTRMSHMAAQSGLRCGQPIDLRTGFDLSNPQSQKKVLDILDKQQPILYSWLQCVDLSASSKT